MDVQFSALSSNIDLITTILTYLGPLGIFAIIVVYGILAYTKNKWPFNNGSSLENTISQRAVELERINQNLSNLAKTIDELKNDSDVHHTTVQTIYIHIEEIKDQILTYRNRTENIILQTLEEIKSHKEATENRISDINYHQDQLSNVLDRLWSSVVTNNELQNKMLNQFEMLVNIYRRNSNE